eukprot:10483492-Lingulodinium_polyedra.AAC.1
MLFIALFQPRARGQLFWGCKVLLATEISPSEAFGVVRTNACAGHSDIIRVLFRVLRARSQAAPHFPGIVR